VRAVAFGTGDQALVVATTGLLLLNPSTARTASISVSSQSSLPLPAPLANIPGNIVQASAGVSGDGQTIVVTGGQPLGRFAALTATREILPTADVGVGVKFDLKKHLRFRAELRDYISAAPSSVIAPAAGASISGIAHDILGFAGLGYTW